MRDVQGWHHFGMVAATLVQLLLQPLAAQEVSLYKMADGNTYSLSSLGATKAGVSGNVQCAVLCLAAPTCFAYLYNTATKSCSLGGDVLPTGAALGADTRLYKRGFDEYLSCSSRSYAYSECVPSSPAVSVTLAQQFSSSTCTSGTSFGLSASGAVWVDAGCRGQFAVRF
ncbi:hypothetical protein RRG08_017145 [Elysia crispata]|uniref:Apple domain-containing protein n=1 Tax=Elysia crispata TaxID=231223 RepID=A0AAE0ZA08_9GAST|nr:hypothetical protein RRG08_017145 [Elysia crispata]